MFEWGDIDDEYRSKSAATHADPALLPKAEKVTTTFDSMAAVIESLRTAIGVAAQEQIKVLIEMLVAKVRATEAGTYEIQLVPAARPFLLAATSPLLLAPPDGIRHPPATQRAGLVPGGRVSQHLPD